MTTALSMVLTLHYGNEDSLKGQEAAAGMLPRCAPTVAMLKSIAAIATKEMNGWLEMALAGKLR